MIHQGTRRRYQFSDWARAGCRLVRARASQLQSQRWVRSRLWRDSRMLSGLERSHWYLAVKMCSPFWWRVEAKSNCWKIDCRYTPPWRRGVPPRFVGRISPFLCTFLPVHYKFARRQTGEIPRTFFVSGNFGFCRSSVPVTTQSSRLHWTPPVSVH